MLHIIQNDPQVPPGNITDRLEAGGLIHIVHHPYLGDPLPELRDVTALIVMGGAMSANDDAGHPFLAEVKLFIKQAVRRDIPYLGICLGGQLLAAALGAEVAANRWEELGTMKVTLTAAGKDDPLFTGIVDPFPTFQWHHDSFDLPGGATLLATSPACPHQAFRVGAHAWGTQFHPEVTEAIIRDWCAWDQATQQRAEELVQAFRSHERDYCRVAERLLDNFLTVANLLP